MGIEWFRRYRGRLRMIAVCAPLAVAGGLYLVRDVVANSAAALVLVLVVVGCAATGDRASGLLASIASAVGFSFFLTAPYLSLRIDNAEDLQLTVLLLLISSAVTELALWGVRQAAAASRQAGFVRGVLESADLAAGVARLPDALERVSESIRKTLGAERVSFEYGEHDSAAAMINRDGSVRCRGVTLDVATDGLPTDRHSVIPVAQHGAQVGYFRITTATTLVRPSVEQLRVAGLLAVQWSLGALTPRPQRSRGTTVPSDPPPDRDPAAAPPGPPPTEAGDPQGSRR